MTPMNESPLREALMQAAHAEASRTDVWLGESAPEDFLREVVDTLEGFLRAAPAAPELKTGDSPAESEWYPLSRGGCRAGGMDAEVPAEGEALEG
jgi:hypothetical protein